MLAYQTINQNSDGFSIVNLPQASFASGATVIIAIAIVRLHGTICWYIRAGNGRNLRDHHNQLLETISGRVVTRRKPPGWPEPVRPALSQSCWYGTPSKGWIDGPSALPQALLSPTAAAVGSHPYLPAILAGTRGSVHGIHQLPFPGFLPVNYQRGCPPVELQDADLQGRSHTTPGPAILCYRESFTDIREEQPQQKLLPKQSSLVPDAIPPFWRPRSTSRQLRLRRVSYA